MGLKDKLLNALGQGMDATRDIAGRAADATRGIAGVAAEKAKAGGRIAKLTMDIAREKEDMKKTFLEIGKLYYDTHKDAPEGFFSQLCEEIALAEKSVAAKQAELDELKASFTTPENPDVEVEFEEIVGSAEAEAECCCDKAADATEDCCCAAEDAAEKAECCCGDAVDEAADAVKDAAEAVVDAIADTAEEIKDCCCQKNDD